MLPCGMPVTYPHELIKRLYARLLRALRPGLDNSPETLLASLQDDFGQLRVTEAEGYRFLYFGDQTEQSCCFVADPAWLEYDYTRAMLLGLFWCPLPAQATLLGLGGGSLANCLLRHFKPGRVTAVELRSAVVDMGRRWLGLSESPDLQLKIGCAQTFIAENPASCDLLFVDLYMEGGISRLQLQAAFFEQCRQALRPGGVLIINQWQLGNTGNPYAGRMLNELFGDDYLQVPVEEGNILLFVPASGRLPLDRQAMEQWADDLETRLGYSLRPYVSALRRASDAPAASE